MLLSLLIMLGVIFRIFLFNIFLSPFIMVTVGLLLVFAAGEPVVDGFKGLAQYTGFPEHVIGIVQSIMLVFLLLALFVSINLDGYILYQFWPLPPLFGSLRKLSLMMESSL